MKSRKKSFWLTPYFYIAAAAALCLVSAAVVLAACYSDSKYMSWIAFALSLAGIAVYCLLMVCRHTEQYAAVALFAFSFAAFLLYISGIYMYFSDVFYSGVTLEAFRNMDASFVSCTVLYLVATVLSNVAVWLKVDTGRFARPQENNSEEEVSS